MNLNMQAQFGGLFKFEVRKMGTDELVRETDWFHNLVLDQGLDGMATKNWFYGCAVGTDGTAPDAKQTALGNQVASVQGTKQWWRNVYNKDGTLYLWQRRSFRFEAGTLKNVTLAEVGIVMLDESVSVSKRPIWNRALITDSDGKPTTITVLEDEYLDVTCEVRCYLNTEDEFCSFNLVDKNDKIIDTIQATIRPVNMDSSAVAEGMSSPLRSWCTSRVTLYSTPIGNINKGPATGNYSSSTAQSTNGLNYINGSHKTTSKAVWGLDSANDIDFKSVTTSTPGINYPAWQIGFSKPIRKTSTQTLTIQLSLSWDRYNAAG